MISSIAAGFLALSLFACADANAVSSHKDRKSKKLTDSIDIRPLFEKYGLDRRQQGSRGTCSVFTVTGALEFAIARKRGHGTRLSVEFLNWAGHQAANRTVDGGFFSELWDGYVKYGISEEKSLPYREAFDPDLIPSSEALESARSFENSRLQLHWIKEWNPETGISDEEFHGIKIALSEDWPVCGGFRWPKKAEWKDGVLQVCPAEEVFDGHSVLLVGYKDDASLPGGGAFIIRNSGGDGSDGMMPYAYVREFMNDAAFIDLSEKEAHR